MCRIDSDNPFARFLLRRFQRFLKIKKNRQEVKAAFYRSH